MLDTTSLEGPQLGFRRPDEDQRPSSNYHKWRISPSIPSLPSASTRRQRRHARISTLMRKNVSLYKFNNPSATHASIALEFGVARSTVSRILEEKDRWAHPGTIASAKYCRDRRLSVFAIEDRMQFWLRECAFHDISVTSKAIRAQAIKIRDEFCSGHLPTFKASKTWLRNFKMRYGIVGEKVRGWGEYYRRTVAFGRGGVTRDQLVTTKAAESSCAQLPVIFEDLALQSLDASSVAPETYPVVDLDAFLASNSRSPSPEAHLAGSTAPSRGHPDQLIADFPALAAGIARSPSLDPQPDVAPEVDRPVIDIDAFIASNSRSPSPADQGTASSSPVGASKLPAPSYSVDQQALDTVISRSPSPSPQVRPVATTSGTPPLSGLRTLALAAASLQSSALLQSSARPYSEAQRLTADDGVRTACVPVPERYTRSRTTQIARSPGPGALSVGSPYSALLEPLTDACEALQCFNQVVSFLSAEEAKLLSIHYDHLSAVRRALVSEVEKVATD